MPRCEVLALLLLLVGQGAGAQSPPAERPVLLGAKLVAPVSAPCISSPFGPRILVGQPQAGTFHYGVDLPAPLGSPIRAAADGTVLRIERSGPGGLEMLVQHTGFVGIYSHFGSVAPAFAEGAKSVKAGEELGVVGLTGVTSGPHVYFGIKIAGVAVDPQPFLAVPLCLNGVSRRSGLMLSADGKILPELTLTALARRSGRMLAPVRPATVHFRRRTD